MTRQISTFALLLLLSSIGSLHAQTSDVHPISTGSAIPSTVTGDISGGREVASEKFARERSAAVKDFYLAHDDGMGGVGSSDNLFPSSSNAMHAVVRLNYVARGHSVTCRVVDARTVDMTQPLQQALSGRLPMDVEQLDFTFAMLPPGHYLLLVDVDGMSIGTESFEVVAR
jgi:hypothetical protein